jgi:hypothetical protein
MVRYIARMGISAYRIFSRKFEGKRSLEHLEDVDIGKKIILKCR